jgi:hypothetical protein
MDGMTRLGNGVEKWIRENWIKDFSLASKVEFRRHDREGYSLSLENVRGRKVYILQSFASDDMTAVFSPKCANRFRVKIKTAIPGISLPLDKVGTATWRDEPGNSDIVVRFDNDRCMTFNEHDRTKYLHVLGETVDEKVWGTILFIHSLINASCADVTILGMHFLSDVLVSWLLTGLFFAASGMALAYFARRSSHALSERSKA